MAQSELGYIFPQDAAKQTIEVGKAIQQADDALLKFTKDSEKLIELLNKQNISFEQLAKAQENARKTTSEIEKITKKLSEEEQKLIEAEKEAIRIQKEREKAAASLEKQRMSGLAQMAKIEAKERELIKALKLEVKTEEDAIRQNKALRAIRKQVNTTTEDGKKKVEELNAKINKNTEIIHNNADVYEKQKINIGNYKEDIISAAKDTDIFGISINKVTGFLSSGAGIVAAITAGVIGLGKAYAKSARGAEDMARAHDRLDSIARSLGNTLADATGETNLFDTIVRGLQQQFFGLSNTIKSDVQVAILSTIRQLEILEADQERQKKSQLDRAEKLRQIRDEERNSFEERKAANDELGKIITEREEETIKFQQEKLKNYQTLLKFDEGNIEIQRAIKQIEFEIADAREEAQGFRSEQLANDLALSREYYANELELSKLSIEAEIKRTGETYELRKKLIDNTLKLELKAAGKNEQLRKIALQKATNAMIDISEKRLNRAELELLSMQIIHEKKIEGIESTNEKEIELEIKKLEQLNEIREESAQKDLETEILLEEQKRQLRQDTFDLSIDFVNTIYGFKIQKLQAELQAAEGNEEKQAEIQRRIAEKEKQQALFNTIINTAVGIVKTIANVGFPAAIPLIALTAAIGAIQTAAIIAQPLPEFAEGTKNAPYEFIAGEKGRELMRLRTGQLVMANTATHFKGNEFKGATIFSNQETERIIAQSERRNSFIFDTSDLKKELILTRKAILKKPIAITDSSGRIIGKQSGNSREIYVNRLKNGR